MPRQVLKVINGPDKPALQWAVAYPDREQVLFEVEGDALQAGITRMDELPDGLSFEIQGVFRSGAHNGARFRGSYSVASRAGLLRVKL